MNIKKLIIKDAKLKEFILKNPNSIIATNSNNQIIHINQEAENLLNLNRKDVVNKDIFCLIVERYI